MRTPRTLAALALIVLTLPIAAGCSSSGSDPDSSGSTVATGSTGSSTKASGRDQAVRFAECMRDNGIGEFPDPDASGELTLDGVVNGSSIDPDIRTKVNRESRVIADNNRTVIDSLIFWQDSPPPGVVLDPAKEQQRLRESQAAGTDPNRGGTPTIERRKRGMLEGIF